MVVFEITTFPWFSDGGYNYFRVLIVAKPVSDDIVCFVTQNMYNILVAYIFYTCT